MPIKQFVIVDLDGTIADCGHRLHHAQAKEWDEFQNAADQDPVLVDIADLVRELSRSSYIIILTGRNERYRHKTIQWLEAAGLDGSYEELIMRPEGDFSQDAAYKIEQLEKRFGDKAGILANVWLAIDDRDTVVEAFRNYGITTLQPALSGY